MASENEASCEADPNFAVICGFLERFSAHCGLANIDFLDLQEMIENTQEVAPELIDMHIKLLRKIRRSVSTERWERAIINICHSYNSQDAWEIERFGYKKARLASKLRLLKQLLEMQFDLNTKFKNEINKMSAADLRAQPLGRDKTGNAYWFQTDDSCQIRVYKEDPDEETWALVAKDREGLVSLIAGLGSGEQVSTDSVTNEDSNSLEIEKPILDTGQVTDNSKKTSEEEEDDLGEKESSETTSGDAPYEGKNEKTLTVTVLKDNGVAIPENNSNELSNNCEEKSKVREDTFGDSEEQITRWKVKDNNSITHKKNKDSITQLNVNNLITLSKMKDNGPMIESRMTNNDPSIQLKKANDPPIQTILKDNDPMTKIKENYQMNEVEIKDNPITQSTIIDHEQSDTKGNKLMNTKVKDIDTMICTATEDDDPMTQSNNKDNHGKMDIRSHSGVGARSQLGGKSIDCSITESKGPLTLDGRYYSMAEGKIRSPNEGQNLSMSEYTDLSVTESKGHLKNESRRFLSTEEDYSITENKNLSMTEGRKCSTEGEDYSVTESKSYSTTGSSRIESRSHLIAEDKDTVTHDFSHTITDAKGSLLEQGINYSVTQVKAQPEDRDQLMADGTISHKESRTHVMTTSPYLTIEGKGGSLSDEKSNSAAEGRGHLLTESIDYSMSENKGRLMVLGSGHSQTEGKDYSMIKAKGYFIADGKRRSPTEGRDIAITESKGHSMIVGSVRSQNEGREYSMAESKGRRDYVMADSKSEDKSLSVTIDKSHSMLDSKTQPIKDTKSDPLVEEKGVSITEIKVPSTNTSQGYSTTETKDLSVTEIKGNSMIENKSQFMNENKVHAMTELKSHIMNESKAHALALLGCKSQISISEAKLNPKHQMTDIKAAMNLLGSSKGHLSMTEVKVNPAITMLKVPMGNLENKAHLQMPQVKGLSITEVKGHIIGDKGSKGHHLMKGHYLKGHSMSEIKGHHSMAELKGHTMSELKGLTMSDMKSNSMVELKGHTMSELKGLTMSEIKGHYSSDGPSTSEMKGHTMSHFRGETNPMAHLLSQFKGGPMAQYRGEKIDPLAQFKNHHVMSEMWLPESRGHPMAELMKMGLVRSQVEDLSERQEDNKPMGLRLKPLTELLSQPMHGVKEKYIRTDPFSGQAPNRKAVESAGFVGHYNDLKRPLNYEIDQPSILKMPRLDRPTLLGKKKLQKPYVEEDDEDFEDEDEESEVGEEIEEPLMLVTGRGSGEDNKCGFSKFRYERNARNELYEDNVSMSDASFDQEDHLLIDALQEFGFVWMMYEFFDLLENDDNSELEEDLKLEINYDIVSLDNLVVNVPIEFIEEDPPTDELSILLKDLAEIREFYGRSGDVHLPQVIPSEPNPCELNVPVYRTNEQLTTTVMKSNPRNSTVLDTFQICKNDTRNNDSVSNFFQQSQGQNVDRSKDYFTLMLKKMFEDYFYQNFLLKYMLGGPFANDFGLKNIFELSFGDFSKINNETFVRALKMIDINQCVFVASKNTRQSLEDKKNLQRFFGKFLHFCEYTEDETKSGRNFQEASSKLKYVAKVIEKYLKFVYRNYKNLNYTERVGKELEFVQAWYICLLSIVLDTRKLPFDLCNADKCEMIDKLTNLTLLGAAISGLDGKNIGKTLSVPVKKDTENGKVERHQGEEIHFLMNTSERHYRRQVIKESHGERYTEDNHIESIADEPSLKEDKGRTIEKSSGINLNIFGRKETEELLSSSNIRKPQIIPQTKEDLRLTPDATSNSILKAISYVETSPIVGETIEESVIYVTGQGNGHDCQTGNERESEQDTKPATSKESVKPRDEFGVASSGYKLGTIIDSKGQTRLDNLKYPPKKSRWDVDKPSCEVSCEDKKEAGRSSANEVGPTNVANSSSETSENEVKFGQISHLHVIDSILDDEVNKCSKDNTNAESKIQISSETNPICNSRSNLLSKTNTSSEFNISNKTNTVNDATDANFSQDSEVSNSTTDKLNITNIVSANEPNISNLREIGQSTVSVANEDVAKSNTNITCEATSTLPTPNVTKEGKKSSFFFGSGSLFGSTMTSAKTSLTFGSPTKDLSIKGKEIESRTSSQGPASTKHEINENTTSDIQIDHCLQNTCSEISSKSEEDFIEQINNEDDLRSKTKISDQHGNTKTSKGDIKILDASKDILKVQTTCDVDRDHILESSSQDKIILEEGCKHEDNLIFECKPESKAVNVQSNAKRYLEKSSVSKEDQLGSTSSSQETAIGDQTEEPGASNLISRERMTDIVKTSPEETLGISNVSKVKSVFSDNNDNLSSENKKSEDVLSLKNQEKSNISTIDYKIDLKKEEYKVEDINKDCTEKNKKDNHEVREIVTRVIEDINSENNISCRTSDVTGESSIKSPISERKNISDPNSVMKIGGEENVKAIQTKKLENVKYKHAEEIKHEQSGSSINTHEDNRHSEDNIKKIDEETISFEGNKGNTWKIKHESDSKESRANNEDSENSQNKIGSSTFKNEDTTINKEEVITFKENKDGSLKIKREDKRSDKNEENSEDNGRRNTDDLICFDVMKDSMNEDNSKVRELKKNEESISLKDLKSGSSKSKHDDKVMKKYEDSELPSVDNKSGTSKRENEGTSKRYDNSSKVKSSEDTKSSSLLRNIEDDLKDKPKEKKELISSESDKEGNNEESLQLFFSEDETVKYEGGVKDNTKADETSSKSKSEDTYMDKDTKTISTEDNKYKEQGSYIQCSKDMIVSDSLKHKKIDDSTSKDLRENILRKDGPSKVKDSAKDQLKSEVVSKEKLNVDYKNETKNDYLKDESKNKDTSINKDIDKSNCEGGIKDKLNKADILPKDYSLKKSNEKNKDHYKAHTKNRDNTSEHLRIEDNSSKDTTTGRTDKFSNENVSKRLEKKKENTKTDQNASMRSKNDDTILRRKKNEEGAIHKQTKNETIVARQLNQDAIVEACNPPNNENITSIQSKNKEGIKDTTTLNSNDRLKITKTSTKNTQKDDTTLKVMNEVGKLDVKHDPTKQTSGLLRDEENLQCFNRSANEKDIKLKLVDDANICLKSENSEIPLKTKNTMFDSSAPEQEKINITTEDSKKFQNSTTKESKTNFENQNANEELKNKKGEISKKAKHDLETLLEEKVISSDHLKKEKIEILNEVSNEQETPICVNTFLDKFKEGESDSEKPPSLQNLEDTSESSKVDKNNRVPSESSTWEVSLEKSLPEAHHNSKTPQLEDLCVDDKNENKHSSLKPSLTASVSKVQAECSSSKEPKVKSIGSTSNLNREDPIILENQSSPDDSSLSDWKAQIVKTSEEIKTKENLPHEEMSNTQSSLCQKSEQVKNSKTVNANEEKTTIKSVIPQQDPSKSSCQLEGPKSKMGGRPRIKVTPTRAELNLSKTTKSPKKENVAQAALRCARIPDLEKIQKEILANDETGKLEVNKAVEEVSVKWNKDGEVIEQVCIKKMVSPCTIKDDESKDGRRKIRINREDYFEGKSKRKNLEDESKDNVEIISSNVVSEGIKADMSKTDDFAYENNSKIIISKENSEEIKTGSSRDFQEKFGKSSITEISKEESPKNKSKGNLSSNDDREKTRKLVSKGNEGKSRTTTEGISGGDCEGNSSRNKRGVIKEVNRKDNVARMSRKEKTESGKSIEDIIVEIKNSKDETSKDSEKHTKKENLKNTSTRNNEDIPAKDVQETRAPNSTDNIKKSRHENKTKKNTKAIIMENEYSNDEIIKHSKGIAGKGNLEDDENPIAIDTNLKPNSLNKSCEKKTTNKLKPIVRRTTRGNPKNNEIEDKHMIKLRKSSLKVHLQETENKSLEDSSKVDKEKPKVREDKVSNEEEVGEGTTDNEHKSLQTLEDNKTLRKSKRGNLNDNEGIEDECTENNSPTTSVGYSQDKVVKNIGHKEDQSKQYDSTSIERGNSKGKNAENKTAKEILTRKSRRGMSKDMEDKTLNKLNNENPMYVNLEDNDNKRVQHFESKVMKKSRRGSSKDKEDNSKEPEDNEPKTSGNSRKGSLKDEILENNENKSSKDFEDRSTRKTRRGMSKDNENTSSEQSETNEDMTLAKSGKANQKDTICQNPKGNEDETKEIKNKLTKRTKRGKSKDNASSSSKFNVDKSSEILKIENPEDNGSTTSKGEEMSMGKISKRKSSNNEYNTIKEVEENQGEIPDKSRRNNPEDKTTDNVEDNSTSKTKMGTSEDRENVPKELDVKPMKSSKGNFELQEDNDNKSVDVENKVVTKTRKGTSKDNEEKLTKESEHVEDNSRNNPDDNENKISKGVIDKFVRKTRSGTSKDTQDNYIRELEDEVKDNTPKKVKGKMGRPRKGVSKDTNEEKLVKITGRSRNIPKAKKGEEADIEAISTKMEDMEDKPVGRSMRGRKEPPKVHLYLTRVSTSKDNTEDLETEEIEDNPTIYEESTGRIMRGKKYAMEDNPPEVGKGKRKNLKGPKDKTEYLDVDDVENNSRLSKELDVKNLKEKDDPPEYNPIETGKVKRKNLTDLKDNTEDTMEEVPRRTKRGNLIFPKNAKKLKDGTDEYMERAEEKPARRSMRGKPVTEDDHGSSQPSKEDNTMVPDDTSLKEDEIESSNDKSLEENKTAPILSDAKSSKKYEHAVKAFVKDSETTENKAFDSNLEVSISGGRSTRGRTKNIKINNPKVIKGVRGNLKKTEYSAENPKTLEETKNTAIPESSDDQIEYNVAKLPEDNSSNKNKESDEHNLKQDDSATSVGRSTRGRFRNKANTSKITKGVKVFLKKTENKEERAEDDISSMIDEDITTAVCSEVIRVTEDTCSNSAASKDRSTKGVSDLGTPKMADEIGEDGESIIKISKDTPKSDIIKTSEDEKNIGEDMPTVSKKIGKGRGKKIVPKKSVSATKLESNEGITHIKTEKTITNISSDESKIFENYTPTTSGNIKNIKISEDEGVTKKSNVSEISCNDEVVSKTLKGSKEDKDSKDGTRISRDSEGGTKLSDEKDIKDFKKESTSDKIFKNTFEDHKLTTQEIKDIQKIMKEENVQKLSESDTQKSYIQIKDNPNISEDSQNTIEKTPEDISKIEEKLSGRITRGNSQPAKSAQTKTKRGNFKKPNVDLLQTENKLLSGSKRTIPNDEDGSTKFSKMDEAVTDQEIDKNTDATMPVPTKEKGFKGTILETSPIRTRKGIPKNVTNPNNEEIEKIPRKIMVRKRRGNPKYAKEDNPVSPKDAKSAKRALNEHKSIIGMEGTSERKFKMDKEEHENPKKSVDNPSISKEDILKAKDNLNNPTTEETFESKILGVSLDLSKAVIDTNLAIDEISKQKSESDLNMVTEEDKDNPQICNKDNIKGKEIIEIDSTKTSESIPKVREKDNPKIPNEDKHNPEISQDVPKIHENNNPKNSIEIEDNIKLAKGIKETSATKLNENEDTTKTLKDDSTTEGDNENTHNQELSKDNSNESHLIENEDEPSAEISDNSGCDDMPCGGFEDNINSESDKDEEKLPDSKHISSKGDTNILLIKDDSSLSKDVKFDVDDKNSNDVKESVSSENKTKLTLATLSLDYTEAANPEDIQDVIKHVTRKRGRDGIDDFGAGKRRKMKSKRSGDAELRRSIEEKKAKEASSSEEEKVEVVVKKKKRKRKTLMGLDIQEQGDIIEQTGVRQSRRIAQIKIKEEAERRKVEEMTLTADPKEKERKKGKAHEDRDYKAEKRKRTKMVITEDETTNDVESDEKKKKLKKKRKRNPNPKFDEMRPWLSSSASSSEEEEEEEVEEVDYEDAGSPLFRSDHEFSPESELEDAESAQPLKRARTVKKEDAVEEELEDDTNCQKCGKSDHPEWILLCDGCDSGWHCSCLRPALLVIPEGDWYCPPCLHLALVKRLQEQLIDFDKRVSKREIEVRRKERLAYVGISLDNVLPSKDHKASESDTGDSRDSSSGDSRSDSGSSSASDSEDEPIYQLRQRKQAHSYRFNDYDELINSAIQEEVAAVASTTTYGRGKDMANIVNSEEPLPPVVPKNTDLPPVLTAPAADNGSDDDEIIRPVKKLIGKKKHRKLNSLDVSSEGEDSDEDFKGSTSEDDEEDFEESGSESSDTYGRRNRRKGPVRRSTRARISRYDKDFINDDSDDDIPRRKKSRSIWDESESEESDRSWGRRKKRPAPRRPAPSNRKKKSKKKKSRSDGSESETFKRKKPRIVFGGLTSEDEEDTVRPRTRGKKINYVDVLGTDSDDSARRRHPPPDEESEDEFVLNEEENPDDGLERDSDDSNDGPHLVEAVIRSNKKGKGKGGITRIKRAQVEEEELFPPLPPLGTEPEPNPIEQMNKNIEAMDEKEMELMMEEEEYANRQLQMVAEQLEKEKRRKELEAARKLQEALAVPIPLPPMPEPVPMLPIIPATVPVPVALVQNPEIPINVAQVDMLSLGVDSPKKRGRKPKSAQVSPDDPTGIGEFQEGGPLLLNPDGTPKKRRGRGKGKKTLEKEAAAAAAAASLLNPGIPPPDDEVNIPLTIDPPGAKEVIIGGKLGVASAPQPFAQSQPKPSVITRMLQTQPGQPSFPVGAMNQQHKFLSEGPRGPSPPVQGGQPLPPPSGYITGVPGPGPRGVPPGPPGQFRATVNHYPPPRASGPSLIRHPTPNPNPPPQNIPPHVYHAHHPMDPSPSGGGPIPPTDRSSPSLVSPASASPLSSKGDPTPPPPAYVRPPMVRFSPSTTAPLRHPSMQIPPQHLQQQPRPPNMPYHPNYYSFPPPEESYSPEQFPPDTPPDTQQRNYDEETGEFGGLVSYFSSQREDDLDT